MTPLDADLASYSDRSETEPKNEGEVIIPPGGRCIDFFAAPYSLKLHLNEDLVPVSLDKETAGKDLLWQRTYGAYLIKLKKVNHG